MLHYARLQSRIKAVIIDNVILIFVMYCTAQLLNTFSEVNPSIRMYLFILYFVLYEPLAVSIFGSTLGHFYSDIKVRREDNEKRKISFHLALLRFLTKATLGWLSLLTVTSSDKQQAIHDTLVGSVVLSD